METITLVRVADGEIIQSKHTYSELGEGAKAKMKTLQRCWWHHRSLPQKTETGFLGFYDSKRCCWDNCHSFSTKSLEEFERLKENSKQAVENAVAGIQRSRKIINKYFKTSEEIKNIDKTIKKEMSRIRGVLKCKDRNLKEKEKQKITTSVSKMKVKIKELRAKQDPKEIIESILSTINKKKDGNDRVDEELGLFEEDLKRFINSITRPEYDKIIKSLERVEIKTVRKPKKFIDSDGNVVMV